MPLSDLLITIDFKFGGISDRSSRIGCPASVLPHVAVVHAGDNQDAGTLAKHGGGDAWTRVQLLALEAPGDGDWHVSVGNSTGQLSKCSGIDDIREGKWCNLWWL